LLSSVKGKSLKGVVIRLGFTITIYNIWIERNLRKFQHQSCTWEIVVQKICNMVRGRLLSLSNLPHSRTELIVNEWNNTVN
jgi:hypothetical protein